MRIMSISRSAKSCCAASAESAVNTSNSSLSRADKVARMYGSSSTTRREHLYLLTSASQYAPRPHRIGNVGRFVSSVINSSQQDKTPMIRPFLGNLL